MTDPTTTLILNDRNNKNIMNTAVVFYLECYVFDSFSPLITSIIGTNERAALLIFNTKEVSARALKSFES